MHPASDLASDLEGVMNAGLLQKAYEHEAWLHGMVAICVDDRVAGVTVVAWFCLLRWRFCRYHAGA